MGLLIAGLFKVPLFGIKSMAAGLLVLAMWLVPTTQGLFFDQTLLRDDQTYFLSHLLPMATLVVVMFKFQKHQNYEFYFLMISVLVGAMFMLGANNVLILYIAIELTSYGSYLLTGFRFDRLGSEASIKYLLFGGGEFCCHDFWHFAFVWSQSFALFPGISFDSDECHWTAPFYGRTTL